MLPDDPGADQGRAWAVSTGGSLAREQGLPDRDAAALMCRVVAAA